MFNIFISILSILITILLIVGIHEFGHFIIARAVGIKVLRFSIGFGKTLFKWHDKKGTEYVLAAIPLGGYVKMLDETEGEVPAEEIKLAYNRQPIYKKMAVVIAGPLSNLLFAFILYWLLFMIGFSSIIPLIGKITPNSIASQAGMKPDEEIISINTIPTLSWTNVAIQLLTYTGEKNHIHITTQKLNSSSSQNYNLDLATWHLNELKPDPLLSLGITPYEPEIPAIIGKILPDSPAAKTNLKLGDKILSINNQSIKDWYQATEIISTHPAQSMTFTVQRAGKTLAIPITTGYKTTFFVKKSGFIGVLPEFHLPKNLLRKNQYGPLEALSHAKQNTLDFTKLNFLLIGKMFTGKVSLQSLGGPITIFETAGNALNIGLVAFIGFLAFLSIAVGVINILPIPGLDGGHLLFQFIELITRRPLSPALQTLLYRIGLIILFLLLIQALINDVMRL